MESTADGYNGGATKVEKNNIQLLLANGGGGSGYNNNTSFASKGIGNGNGGVRLNSVVNPTNGTGFIFNDASLGLAGGGGGGGAGGSQQISTKADASPGGTGGVYIRFKSA